MRVAGEAFAIAAMLAAVGALIALIAWHLRRIDPAIDLDLSDVCVWGDIQNVPDEARISGSKDHGCPHDKASPTP